MPAWTLVTGGAKRLGADICLKLAQEGHHIVVHYNHSEAEALDVAKQCRSYGVEAAIIQGDLAFPETTQDFINRYTSQFPETKVLVNNVGNYFIKSAMGTPATDWEELFETNLHAPFRLTQALIPAIERQQGSVINIGTQGINHVQADIHATAYNITKTSLWMLTRSLARELAPRGVQVNMVSPGYLDIAVDLPADVTKLPMKRAAKCEEVSRVIAFLLKPESHYITGQNIEVAGGVGLN